MLHKSNLSNGRNLYLACIKSDIFIHVLILRLFLKKFTTRLFMLSVKILQIMLSKVHCNVSKIRNGNLFFAAAFFNL